MDKKISLPQEEEDPSAVSKKDLKCIWMTAGLIFYKLCKYDLQCERCPLDWELRNLSFPPSFDSKAIQGRERIIPEGSARKAPLKKGRQRENDLREDPSLLNIKGSLFYHPGHTWIKVEKADEARVGVDYFLASLLWKVNVVILPLSGKQGVQGENLCSIIQEEGILHIVFPVSALTLSVNEKLKDHPDLIREDPLGDGFLLTLKPEDFQRDQNCLLSGDEARSWYRREWERFKGAVLSGLPREQGELGITMQDGGITLKEIKNSVDPGRYIQLVRSFLKKGTGFIPP
jgi:glycine cleavage system H protein